MSFIESLWEAAYFMYKLQNFNQQIQWKTTSQVLFKHFMQDREAAIRRRSFTLKSLKIICEEVNS